MKTIIMIPARLGSSRLPNKVMADINGIPLISRVANQALEADIAPVVVACDSPQIADLFRGTDVRTVLTDPNLPSGSDRIYQALESFDSKMSYDTIINLQGDLPNIQPDAIKAVLSPLLCPLADSLYSAATIVTKITDPKEIHDPNIVKVALAKRDNDYHEALYFSRAAIPYGQQEYFHHIGIYSYRRQALEKFVSLQPSGLEIQERLEQLRLLENGMKIGVSIVKDTPISVDTHEDLLEARKSVI